jgi:hypothetical protein
MSDRGSGSLHSNSPCAGHDPGRGSQPFRIPCSRCSHPSGGLPAAFRRAPPGASGPPRHTKAPRNSCRALRPTRRSVYGRSHSPGHAQVGPGLNERGVGEGVECIAEIVERIRHLPGIGRYLVEPRSDSPDARASNLSTDSSRVSIVLASRLRVGRSSIARRSGNTASHHSPLKSSSVAVGSVMRCRR